MWPWTDWKLRRALRRYRRERDLEAVLQMDWHRDLDLSAFFTDVEERLHGEEITRLRQKQAEYLALQNQINPHFLYNAHPHRRPAGELSGYCRDHGGSGDLFPIHHLQCPGVCDLFR